MGGSHSHKVTTETKAGTPPPQTPETDRMRRGFRDKFWSNLRSGWLGVRTGGLSLAILASLYALSEDGNQLPPGSLRALRQITGENPFLH